MDLEVGRGGKWQLGDWGEFSAQSYLFMESNKRYPFEKEIQTNERGERKDPFLNQGVDV
jgi:hypothetical protein